MISNFRFRNFKCLRDVTVHLERFTVFVGPNASGKSSILQALNLLCRIFRAPQQMNQAPQQMNQDAEILKEVSRGSNEGVELVAETGGQWYRYRPGSRPSQQPFFAGPGGGAVGHAPWTGDGWGVASALDSTQWNPWQPKPNDPAPLPLSVMLRLEASKLIAATPTVFIAPTPTVPDPTVMIPDGTGLHSALANMALNDPDSWQQLQANLRRIIPTIRRLRHTKAAMHQPTSLLFDTVGADSLSASQVSEGTLLVLGLLAALYAPDRPNLVLLDDLDKGLHPKAQKELISLLRGLLETNAELQIVATTHSPYLLDCMEPSEVRMTHLNDDGSTICAALTRHPKFQKWKDEFHSGEMWSLFGEKWVLEPEVATP